MKTIIENEEGVVRGRSINFIGFVFNHERTLLRKSIKKNFARKAKKGNKKAIASYKGWCMHCNGAHLYKSITGMSFREHGINSEEIRDGQKYFDVPIRKIGEMVNRKITVEDFSENVKTKAGEGRDVIKIKDEYGNEFKIITSSRKVISELHVAREKEEKEGEKIFPCETEIRCNVFNNNAKEYYLL